MTFHETVQCLSRHSGQETSAQRQEQRHAFCTVFHTVNCMCLLWQHFETFRTHLDGVSFSGTATLRRRSVGHYEPFWRRSEAFRGLAEAGPASRPLRARLLKKKGRHFLAFEKARGTFTFFFLGNGLPAEEAPESQSPKKKKEFQKRQKALYVFQPFLFFSSH